MATKVSAAEYHNVTVQLTIDHQILKSKPSPTGRLSQEIPEEILFRSKGLTDARNI